MTFSLNLFQIVESKGPRKNEKSLLDIAELPVQCTGKMTNRDSLRQIMVRERICMSSLPVELLLRQLDLASIVGCLLCFSVVLSLLALVGRTCHLQRRTGMSLSPAGVCER
jgi:hypothetical protein